jgi:hypothetical protein
MIFLYFKLRESRDTQLQGKVNEFFTATALVYPSAVA